MPGTQPDPSLAQAGHPGLLNPPWQIVFLIETVGKENPFEQKYAQN